MEYITDLIFKIVLISLGVLLPILFLYDKLKQRKENKIKEKYEQYRKTLIKRQDADINLDSNE